MLYHYRDKYEGARAARVVLVTEQKSSQAHKKKKISSQEKSKWSGNIFYISLARYRPSFISADIIEYLVELY